MKPTDHRAAHASLLPRPFDGREDSRAGALSRGKKCRQRASQQVSCANTINNDTVALCKPER